MTWEPFDPYPEYPALLSLRAGRVLVAVRSYAFGQCRVQLSIDNGHGFGLGIVSPEL